MGELSYLITGDDPAEFIMKVLTALSHPSGVGLERGVGALNRAREAARLVVSTLGPPPMGSDPLASVREHPDYWKAAFDLMHQLSATSDFDIQLDPDVQYMEYGDPYSAFQVAREAVEAMKRTGRFGGASAFLVGYSDGRPVFLTSGHAADVGFVEIGGKKVPVEKRGALLLSKEPMYLGDPLPVKQITPKSPYIVPEPVLGEADVVPQASASEGVIVYPSESSAALPGSSGSPFLAYDEETGKWVVVGTLEGVAIPKENPDLAQIIVQRFLREPPDRYDPSKLRDDVLRDDFRIVLAWYANGIDKYSTDDLKRYLKKILLEIHRRVKDGRMKFRIHMDRLKPKSKHLVREVLHELPHRVSMTLLGR